MSGAMPFRPALPMNRAGARLGLTVGIAIALAGCAAPSRENAPATEGAEKPTMVAEGRVFRVCDGPRMVFYDVYQGGVFVLLNQPECKEQSK